jgi:hypothetical protein
MIGVLCSDNAEKACAEKIQSGIKNINNIISNKFLVFTISNIDFDKRLVTGSLVSEDKIEAVNDSLPAVVLNLSIQRSSKLIKLRKKLEEIEGVELINDVNRFDQWMIMDMISSAEEVRKHLLPYYIYDKKTRDYRPQDDKTYVIFPAVGSSISRVIYAIPDPNSDKVTGSQYFKKGTICDYIDASLCQNYWVFIEVPDLLSHFNHPVIVRNYIQKKDESQWTVLGRTINPEGKLENEVLKKVDETAIKIANYIQYFLPCFWVGFIDFILDTDNNPYFIHLGGAELDFLDKNHNEEFYKNIIQLEIRSNRTAGRLL